MIDATMAVGGASRFMIGLEMDAYGLGGDLTDTFTVVDIIGGCEIGIMYPRCHWQSAKFNQYWWWR